MTAPMGASRPDKSGVPPSDMEQPPTRKSHNQFFQSSFAEGQNPPNFSIANPFGDDQHPTASQGFVENDLLKAANIYQQFDKKGNLYENRLYAKTSIN